MKQINSTHIMRISDYDTSVKMINMLRGRIKTTLRYSVSRNIGVRGAYYSKKKTSFFNVHEAIEALTILVNSDDNFKINFDYSGYLEILQQALADRIAYGDMIPDTADEFVELYRAKDIYVPKPRTSKVNRVKIKHINRADFVKKFNSAEINWR